jgi:hypothetical protein
VIEPLELFSHMLLGVWGASSDDVYAVGLNSTVVHFDGADWSIVDMPPLTAEHVDFVAVWGSSSSDVYVVGENWVDELGVVVHFDGAEWTVMDIPESTIPLSGIWGSSGNDVYAVGPRLISSNWLQVNPLGERIIHFDGEQWIAPDWPQVTQESLYFYDVWGSYSEDVYLVGKGGMAEVHHFNGFELEVEPTSDYWGGIHSAWGTSAQNLYVLIFDNDTHDCVAHFDGTFWSTSSPCHGEIIDGVEFNYPDPFDRLMDIWGAEPNTMYVTDAAGTIWRLQDKEWSLEYLTDENPDDDVPLRARALWGPSADEIFAVGTAIWKYDSCDPGGETDTDTGDPACMDGPCCDTDTDSYLSNDAQCNSWYTYQCSQDTCGGETQRREYLQYCTGSSSGCNGQIVEGAWETTDTCEFDELCETDGETYASCTLFPSLFACECAACAGWIDETTGYCWMDPPDENYHWDEAVAFCEDLSLGTLSEWELPDIDELISLVRGCVDGEPTSDLSLSGCGLNDPDCLDTSCLGTACASCDVGLGPGLDGCYWDPALNGDCQGAWSASVGEFSNQRWVVQFHYGWPASYQVTGMYDVRCLHREP